jgi:nucleotide-binding universal stress UspA family protein
VNPSAARGLQLCGGILIRVADRPSSHVLVACEPSRRGDAALREAARLATESGARLTALAVAVTEREDRGCCDTRSVYWNGVVRERAADDLNRARTVLEPLAEVRLELAVGSSLAEVVEREAARLECDLIVVPRAGRLRRGGGAWIRSLRRRTTRSVVLAPLTARRS